MKFSLLLLISAISSLQVEDLSQPQELLAQSHGNMPDGFSPSKFNEVSTMNVKDNQINGLKDFKSFLEASTTTVDQFALYYHPLCKDCENWRPVFLDILDKLE